MKFATCMAVVICSAVSAQAAQPVSNDSLKSVGLSNIVVMSDAQGTQVRAKKFYVNRMQFGLSVKLQIVAPVPESMGMAPRYTLGYDNSKNFFYPR